MTRELARQKDRPQDIIIRLTGSQKSQMEYNLDENSRLNEELEERDHRIEKLTRRITELEKRQTKFTLYCLLREKEMTIDECRAQLDHWNCNVKNCNARQTLLAEL